MTVGIDDIEAARQRLAPVLKRTPLQYSATLSRMLEAEVLVKPENLQKTGSFKIRGAYNRVMALAAGTGAPRRGGGVGGESWPGAFLRGNGGRSEGDDRDAGDRGDRQGRGHARLRPDRGAARHSTTRRRAAPRSSYATIAAPPSSTLMTTPGSLPGRERSGLEIAAGRRRRRGRAGGRRRADRRGDRGAGGARAAHRDNRRRSGRLAPAQRQSRSRRGQRGGSVRSRLSPTDWRPASSDVCPSN